jgi:hypothetical protein
MNLNFEQQVLKTAGYIIRNNLSRLDLKKTSYQEESCWGQICIELIKKFDRLISLRLWKNWKYNVRGYQDFVCRILEQRGFNSFQQNSEFSWEICFYFIQN